MSIFILILRILLLIGAIVGIILMGISNVVANGKKFKKQEDKQHYAIRLKLIGFLVIASAFALLIILGLIV